MGGNSNHMKRTFTILASAALAVGLAAAQAPAGPGHHGFGPGGAMHGGQFFARHVADALGLTDAQKEQAKAIFQGAREESQPLAAQLKQNHKAVADAVKTGKSEAEIQQLAQSQGPLLGQLAGIHAKAMAKFYGILTPEQRDKADKMHDQMMQHFGGRFNH